MSARDMTGLVGKDADNLAGRVGGDQQTGIDEEILAASNESVKGVIVDDQNAYSAGVKP